MILQFTIFVRAQVCAMLPEAGSCTKQVTRYYFSPKDGACDSFVWSGCKVTSYWPLDIDMMRILISDWSLDENTDL